MSGDLILETRDLTKEFEGFVAVSNVNLKVKRGAIHALIGLNGAGKTTVFNLLTKFHVPTRGRMPAIGWPEFRRTASWRMRHCQPMKWSREADQIASAV